MPATGTVSASSASGQVAPYRVLICDDQPDVLEALRLLLKGQGWQTVSADSPEALMAQVRSGSFDLILVDLNYTRDTTSGAEGIDLLSALEEEGNSTPVMVMTAWSSFDLAVEAMRRGACDFIQKPWDNERLLAAIRKQAESERRRKSELEIAANVQQKLFPRNLRKFHSLDYAGHCVAAKEVGGDYYDFLEITDRTLGFVLADVSGKGVPAALLMANLQACFRNQQPGALLRPAEVLEGVNRHFYESTAAERFATLFFGGYDDHTRRLRYVNCAQLAPILLRADGLVERLQPTALMLGAFRRWHCVEQQTELRPGDLLVVFSDGVTEAGIERGNDFGEQRLLSLVCQSRGDSADRIVHRIIDSVAAFSGPSRTDDVTVVVLRAL
jgi:sigma-B regulation protein RsbU (phosphoserine phosphatase)